MVLEHKILHSENKTKKTPSTELNRACAEIYFLYKGIALTSKTREKSRKSTIIPDHSLNRGKNGARRHDDGINDVISRDFR